MKRRAPTLILALTLALSLLCPAARAAESGPLGENVTGELEDGILHVTGRGPMTDYDDYNGDSWYYAHREEISILIMEDGVTTVGDYVFWNLEDLQTVRLSRDLTSVGQAAFAYCSSLREMPLPAGVTSIGDWAFVHCSSLETITLPAGLETLGEDLFYGCDSLKTIRFGGTQAAWTDLTGDLELPESLETIETADGTIAFAGGEARAGTCGDSLTWALDDQGTLTVRGTGAMTDYGHGDAADSFIRDASPWNSGAVTRVVLEEGVTSVGAAAFEDCGNLTEVSLPSTLERIGDEAFAFCDQLALPALPAGLVSIGDRAFWMCDRFTTFTVPAGVKELGENPFIKAHNLKEVLVEEGGAFRSVNGVLYSGDGKTLITYPLGRPNTVFTTPDGVETIGAMSFFSSETLQRVTLSEGVTRVCQWALNGSVVTRLDLPLSLKQVDPNSINYCDSLTDVWYGGMKADWDRIAIGEGNPSLMSARRHYADGQTELGFVAAGNCGKASQPFTGEIPPGGDFSVFWAASVTWTLDSLGTLRITGEGSLCETPQITYGSRYVVASPWWEYRERIRRIEIGEGVTYIRFNNFRDLPNLTDVVFPVSLSTTGVDRTAFYNDSALKDIWFRGTKDQWNRVTVSTSKTSTGQADSQDQYIKRAEVHYEYTDAPDPQPTVSGLTAPVVSDRQIMITASADRPARVVFAVYDGQGRMLGLRQEDLEEGETRELTFSPDDLTGSAGLQGEGGVPPSEICRLLLLGERDWKPLCDGKSVLFLPED